MVFIVINCWLVLLVINLFVVLFFLDFINWCIFGRSEVVEGIVIL